MHLFLMDTSKAVGPSPQGAARAFQSRLFIQNQYLDKAVRMKLLPCREELWDRTGYRIAFSNGNLVQQQTAASRMVGRLVE